MCHMSEELTFVLTDVESSTALWERYPGQMSAAIAAHERIIASAVAAHGGELVRERGEGDSTFAVFTSPIAAVRAAAAFARELFGAPWSEEAPLRVRIAVNTGEVESRDGDYYGTTVNRAARIRSLAFGGQVLLGQKTAAEVAGQLPAATALLDLGPRELKDLAAPEHVFELRMLDADAPPEPLSDIDASNNLWMERLLSGGFVDRDRERRTLDQAWASAAAGERELVLVEGEPGIGKTTVAAAVAHHAVVDGGIVLYGRWDEEFLAPFQALREALSTYARACPRSILRHDLRDHTEPLARLFPEITRAIELEVLQTSGPTEAERLRLFEALDAWLVAIASRRPVCLVLDDLQWADRPSFLFLLHLVRAPVGAPILVVATFRAEAIADGDPARYIPELYRHPNVRRVSLSGLGRSDIQELVEHMSGDDPRQSELAEDLRRETGGNPLFLREIVRHLRDTRSLEVAENRRVDLPDSVRDLVRWRLRPLEAATRDALSVASVIGHEFDSDVLARATDLGTVAVSDALEESRRAGVLQESGEAGERFAFTHAVVRRALLDDLSGARRASFHLRIGEALEGRVPAPAPGQLAHHFCSAVTPHTAEKAIAYATAAADDAMSALAFEAAITHLRRALEIASAMRPDDDALRCELLIRLGAAYDRAGEYNDRAACFREAADIARRLGRSDLITRAALGFGGLLPAATEPDPEGQMLLEEALEALGEGDSPERALVLGRLAHSLQLVPPRSRRVALADEAVAMARRLGDPTDLAAALISRCWALDGPDDLEDQLSAAEEIRSLGEATGDRVTVLRSLHLRSDALFEAGDWDALKASVGEMKTLAEELRYPEYIRIVRGWDAVFAGIEGRYEDAFAVAQQVHSLLQAMGHPQSELVFQGLIFPIQWLQGELIDGLELYEMLAEQMPERMLFQLIVGWATSEAGMADRARQALDAINPEEVVALDHNFTWWPSIVGLANVASLLGDEDWAQLLYELILPFADRVASAGSSSFAGVARYHLAVLASTLGLWDEAAVHFEAALAGHERIGARPFLAMTQVAYARTLFARDEGGDAERAKQLQQAALRTADELGLKAVTYRASLNVRS